MNKNPVSALPVIVPLTASQVNEFLSSYAPMDAPRFLKNTSGYLRDTQSVFRALSGETQAVLKRLYGSGLLDDDSLMDVLAAFRNDYPGYGRVDGEKSRIADPVLLASALLMERAVAERPNLVEDFSYGSLSEFSRQVVLGCMAHAANQGTLFDPVSAQGQAAVLGAFTFTFRGEGSRLRDSTFDDAQGYTHDCVSIGNSIVATFVMEHPELADQVEEFMRQRELGNSDVDAQFMIEHFTETAVAPAVGAGRL